MGILTCDIFHSKLIDIKRGLLYAYKGYDDKVFKIQIYLLCERLMSFSKSPPLTLNNGGTTTG